ncbi:MAG: GNAT family N-acetyltransferase [Propionibacteriaceae bacterium]|nr:GNAT family N-acetyltransferase [Propionibacteriaceae bacterium]
MRIALAHPDQYAEIGACTVSAYAHFHASTPAYRTRLADAAARAAQAELWVATDADGGVLGSVTRCPPGSPWREIAREGEGEFRMLAVAPAAQGCGVGAALVRHVVDLCRADGDHAIVLSTSGQMTIAQGLYRRLGFARLPERDWSPEPEVDLMAFALPLHPEPAGFN